MINMSLTLEFFPKGEATLESPEYYRKLLNMASLTGVLMISSGAETHRVEDTVHRILSTTGFEHAEAMVFPTGLVVTLSDPSSVNLSITERVPGVSNNLGRVADVNQVSREFCSGKITLDEAVDKLNIIKNERRFSNFMIIVGYILASCGFCVMFGGNFGDAICTFFCGLAAGLVNVYLGPKIGKGFVTCIVASAAVTVTAVIVAFLSKQIFDISLQAQCMIIGGIMPLVPGLAMTNAARDILHGDHLSGGARAIEAFCVAAMVAVGVGAGMAIANVCGFADTLILSFNLSIETFTRFLAATACSAIAVVGFALLFEIHPRLMPYCALCGAISWAVYLVADYFGASGIWSTFYATLAVDLFSHISARTLKTPVIIFLISGLLPLVPGISIYKSVYFVMYGEGDAGETLLGAILCVGAIALAIFLMDTLLDMDKRLRAYIKQKRTHKT